MIGMIEPLALSLLYWKISREEDCPVRLLTLQVSAVHAVAAFVHAAHDSFAYIKTVEFIIGMGF